MPDSVSGVSASSSSSSSAIAQTYQPDPSTSTSDGLVSALENTASAAAGVLSGADMGNLENLINTQMKFQEQMQAITMVSNIEKSKHDTRMAPIRNIRVD